VDVGMKTMNSPPGVLYANQDFIPRLMKLVNDVHYMNSLLIQARVNVTRVVQEQK